ncbi:hypothetical protein PF003_g36586 [Phytophthora fragariae]|nr:hypothetical protein PF003_g36586 [Phytophthora fragariae]
MRHRRLRGKLRMLRCLPLLLFQPSLLRLLRPLLRRHHRHLRLYPGLQGMTVVMDIQSEEMRGKESAPLHLAAPRTGTVDDRGEVVPQLRPGRAQHRAKWSGMLHHQLL